VCCQTTKTAQERKEQTQQRVANGTLCLLVPCWCRVLVESKDLFAMASHRFFPLSGEEWRSVGYGEEDANDINCLSNQAAVADEEEEEEEEEKESSERRLWLADPLMTTGQMICTECLAPYAALGFVPSGARIVTSTENWNRKMCAVCQMRRLRHSRLKSANRVVVDRACASRTFWEDDNDPMSLIIEPYSDDEDDFVFVFDDGFLSDPALRKRSHQVRALDADPNTSTDSDGFCVLF